MHYDKRFDIVVAGLGTAGAIALITAAKKGLRVLGIERLNAMGGTGTLGGISHYYYGSAGGEFEELDAAVDRLRDKICVGCTAKRTDIRACIFEQEAQKYGAEILFNSVVTEVYKEGCRVCGVECFSGGRLIKIAAGIVIDATGEADICRMAGCGMQGGRESDAQMQTFANVSMVRSGDNVYGINKDAGYIRQSECGSLSEQIMKSTALSLKIVGALRDRVSFITNTALIGCREGNRIIGEQSITLDGCTGGNEAKNPVFYAFSNIDNHSKDTAFEDIPMKDWYIAAGLWGVSVRTAVPMGALIPKGYDGILAAGRCISVEHNAAACVRMMRDMKKCGEAAAVMAAMAVKSGCSLKDIDYSRVASELKKSGCLAKRGCRFANRTRGENGFEEFEWLTDRDAIISGLSGDVPGIAIWSAKLLGGAIKAELINALESGNENLRKHSALALGLMGERAALEQLRLMAAERDLFIPKSSIKYTYARGVSAVYLLGRMRDAQAVGLLVDIIRSGGRFDEEKFTPDELHSCAGDMRFMFIQNAAASLFEIAKAYPERAQYIYGEIKANLFKDGFDIKIGLKDNSFIEYSMSGLLKRQLRNNAGRTYE